MQLDPPPRQDAHDAQQPKPRCGDPTGDIALPGRQIVAVRVALSGRPAARELAVIEHSRSDQLHIDLAEHTVGVAARNLLKRVAHRFAVMLERPRLNPPADRIVLLRNALGVLKRVRAATLELAPAPARARRISKPRAHHSHRTTHYGWNDPGRQRGETWRARLRAQLESTIVAKRNGATHTSLPRARSRRDRGSRTSGRRGLGEQLEQTEAQRLADSGWIEWGGELIWVAGFTSGGAPYGRRVCDFDRMDLEAMGFDIAALDDAGLLAATQSSIDQSNDCLRDDDVPF
jgi:hypothetical protein